MAAKLYEAAALALAEYEQTGQGEDMDFVRRAFAYADRLMQARDEQAGNE